MQIGFVLFLYAFCIQSLSLMFAVLCRHRTCVIMASDHVRGQSVNYERGTSSSFLVTSVYCMLFANCDIMSIKNSRKDHIYSV